MTRQLILASTSPYRAELLGRLGLDFLAIAPQVDEDHDGSEPAAALAARLARAKALAVARLHPDAIVIGSDQTVACEGHILGKPGTHEAAVAQLSRLSGREAGFHTAVAVVSGGALSEHMALTMVRLRALQADEIERYLAAEPAYDCAGSFRCEGLGISLFESIRADDPTALIGLPLIAVAQLLRACGLAIP